MFVPTHSTYFATYFTITGLHGLHVLGGVIVFIYMWLPVSCEALPTQSRSISPIELRSPAYSGTLSIWSGSSFSRSFILL